MKKEIKINKNKLKAIIAIGIVSASLILFFAINANNQSQIKEESIPSDMREVTLYKDANCGCCDGHAKMYKEAGFEIEIIESDNMDAIKEEHDISRDLQSCHTAIMGEYVVEGHMPLEGIKMLIETRPNIRGIALPGMPIGTPGMPGLKTETYKIKNIDSKETIMEI